MPNKAIQARSKSNYAIKKGVLKPSPTCEDCGLVGKVDGHHDDYDKPLEVRWLCRRCHMKKDGRLENLHLPINVFKAVITKDRNRGQLRLPLEETYQERAA